MKIFNPLTLCRLSSLFFISLFCFSSSLAVELMGQTIAEKLAGGEGNSDLPADLNNELIEVNERIYSWREEIKSLFKMAQKYYCEGASDEQYKIVLNEIRVLRKKIRDQEEMWRLQLVQAGNGESYALWHQPSTTIGDIILDYGSQDYVYVIPPEIASMKLSLDSSLPIPRSSWEQMLEELLMANGIGIKQLNPFLRQLYLVDEDLSTIQVMTNKRADLSVIPPNVRVGFILRPDPSEVKRVWLFLNKFVNPKSTVLQHIGREIIIIATVAEVKELLKLYDFAVATKGDRHYQVIALKKADPAEMAEVLGNIFEGLADLSSDGRRRSEDEEDERIIEGSRCLSSSMQVIPLRNIAPGIVLIGTKEEIIRAAKIIKEVESQIAGEKDRVVYTYRARHSNANDLAQVLDKLYPLMLQAKGGVITNDVGPVANGTREQNIAGQVNNGGPVGVTAGQQGVGGGPGSSSENANKNLVQLSVAQPPPAPIPLSSQQLYQDGFYQEGAVVVDTTPIEPLRPAFPRSREPDRSNFLVDETTNTILMVVEEDALPKIKQLLAKIDIPKKMVQIEVMLFEKRLTRRDNCGLNLLRVGSRASQTHDTGATFNDRRENPLTNGIFNFFLSREKTDSGIPAFDIVYSFLISQQDLHLQAAPSVVTLNQTPALIAIQDEISINTGIFNLNTVGGVTTKDAYTRAQYGITIKVTPTIHMPEPIPGRFDDEGPYVTMDSELTFDTIVPSLFNVDRPDVIRRQIVNRTRVPDGQTVIIGGLRRKDGNSSQESIPFLGEIPGFGKLFSTSTLEDRATEMFVFITPRIIIDPVSDFDKLRREALCRRPGDMPEFLRCIECALRREKYQLLAGTMNCLFGPECPEFYIPPGEEYDGYFR